MDITGRTIRWRKYQTMKLTMTNVNSVLSRIALLSRSSWLWITPSATGSVCVPRNCSMMSERMFSATQYSRALTRTSRKRLDSFLVSVLKNCFSTDSYKAFNVCILLLLGTRVILVRWLTSVATKALMRSPSAQAKNFSHTAHGAFRAAEYCRVGQFDITAENDQPIVKAARPSPTVHRWYWRSGRLPGCCPRTCWQSFLPDGRFHCWPGFARQWCG